LILVRELDERLGLEAIIGKHLNDSRHGLNTQFPLRGLLRQSIYSRLAGYEDLNDAARLSTDPTFRLIGSLLKGADPVGQPRSSRYDPSLPLIWVLPTNVIVAPAIRTPVVALRIVP
jgi:hypothetical protein